MRYPFPDAASRYVLVMPATDNTAPLSEIGAAAVVYLPNAAGTGASTTLADIQNLAGSTVANSTLTTTGTSALPDFLGPDGVTDLWVAVAGRTAQHIRCNVLAYSDAQLALKANVDDTRFNNIGGTGVDPLTMVWA